MPRIERTHTLAYEIVTIDDAGTARRQSPMDLSLKAARSAADVAKAASRHVRIDTVRVEVMPEPEPETAE